jgi:hypothetical protein
MGYYTDYNLTWEDPQDRTIEHDQEMQERFGYVMFDTEECKWYEWKEHMKEYSELYPDILFILTGVGEDNALWRAYIQNGKMHYIPGTIEVITNRFFNEEFDPEKMKSINEFSHL